MYDALGRLTKVILPEVPDPTSGDTLKFVRPVQLKKRGDRVDRHA